MMTTGMKMTMREEPGSSLREVTAVVRALPIAVFPPAMPRFTAASVCRSTP